MPDTPDAPDVVVSLQEANAGLRAENAELKALVAEQSEKIARLERLISRNSGNSSMPPGLDDVPGRKPPAPKTRGGKKRKPGKQPGAPGMHLAWNDDPDDRVGHFPAGTCECGADLSGAADLGIRYSHQVTDLPEVKARTVQHDRHAAACGCGREHVAAAPAETGGSAPGTVTYGTNIQAWCVFLMVMHHVPVERCADILESMTGTRPSDGWVHSLLGRAAAAVAAANEAILAVIMTAAVLCGDETPIRSGPGPKARKKYLLVACTSLLTYYFLGERTLTSFEGFIYSRLHGAVVVHDRYVNYDHFDGITHQLCCAHLLRDLEACAQDYPDAIWPGQAAEALRALIHAANTARACGQAVVPASAITEDLKLFRNAVNVGLSALPPVPGRKQPAGRPLLECLKNREADVLRFLTDTAIPPTSNQAERDLRPAKTQQKISGRLRSVPATRHRYAIRGYISTARKHGHDILTATRDALTGTPWMPPAPAAA